MTQSENKLKLGPTNPVVFFNLKIFLRTAFFCGFLYVLMVLWLERITPPEGYVFEKLPPITGTWKSEDCGVGRSSRTCSKVGDTYVFCSMAGYYPFGGSGRSHCDSLRIPNGETVTAYRVKAPSILNKNIYLATIYSYTASKTYQAEDDNQIREIWIRESIQSASGGAIELMIILYCTQMGLLAHSISKGNKK